MAPTKQLALDLAEYPRPIAWTLSEVDRAVGDRDRLSMLFTAFEEVTRYLVLVQLARYTEYWEAQQRDESVDQRLSGLRRPSFGHHVGALTALDAFLTGVNDAFGADLAASNKSPSGLALLNETGNQPTKKSSLARLLAHVVSLRNREKGHGYSGQLGAKAIVRLLEPCLSELLTSLPEPLRRRLVWIERIEFIDTDRSVVTLLELMGTQRARRMTQDVKVPGGLRKGFVYLWDGENSPLQMTPFLHLEQTPNDEIVYALSGIGGEPVYQARGSSASARHPDRLMAQFQARAPFLLHAPGSVTTPRPPAAAKLYRGAVEVALADGQVTAPEAERLEQFREEVGLTREEAQAIHDDLGWVTEVTTAAANTETPAESAEPSPNVAEQVLEETSPTEPAPSGAPEVTLAAILEGIRTRLVPRLGDDARLTIDAEIDIGTGELWIELGPTQGVSVWFPRKRGDRLIVAVGFYSTNRHRDQRYRKARQHIEDHRLPGVPSGWTAWSRDSRGASLALEARKAFPRQDCAADEVSEEITTIASALTAAASASLQLDETAATSEPAPPKVSENLDFALEPLDGKPRIRGSVWIPRILWALEWGRRNGQAVMTAADVARALGNGGVTVPSTNTARAFRTPADDPREAGLCDEPDHQRYSINAAGRRALAELLQGQRA